MILRLSRFPGFRPVSARYRSGSDAVPSPLKPGEEEIWAKPAEGHAAERLAKGQPAKIVAASAIRWSFDQGGPSVARGP